MLFRSVAGMTLTAGDTSMPTRSRYPPFARNAFCMSTTINAVSAGVIFKGSGRAGIFNGLLLAIRIMVVRVESFCNNMQISRCLPSSENLGLSGSNAGRPRHPAAPGPSGNSAAGRSVTGDQPEYAAWQDNAWRLKRRTG